MRSVVGEAHDQFPTLADGPQEAVDHPEPVTVVVPGNQRQPPAVAQQPRDRAFQPSRVDVLPVCRPPTTHGVTPSPATAAARAPPVCRASAPASTAAVSAATIGA